MTQAEKFKEIAAAIRGVEGRTAGYAMKANNFAQEIGKLDPKLNAHSDDFENGYYGLRAVKCASSYLLARVLGTDKFAYRNTTLFGYTAEPSRPLVRDGEYGRIDCSTYVGLCLRGIPYENSPYAAHKEANAQWEPSQELSGMYGTEGWEFRELDAQHAGVFNNVGISGCSSIRYAADFGRYFYKYGRVLYDQSVEGAITDHSVIGLQPGDLVFWDTSDGNSDGRFKSISHVAMVAEDVNYYYQVTGSTDQFDQNVVFYTEFAEADTAHPNSSLVLAVRPDYRLRMPKEETPAGVNILEYPWEYSRGLSYSKNGLTLTLVDKHSFIIDGTASTNTLIDLKSSNDGGDHFTLSPGTYTLTGIENFTGISFALQVKDSAGNDFSAPVRYPTTTGYTNEFTLTEETDVTVKLYISSGKVLSNVTVTPTLIAEAREVDLPAAEGVMF